MAATRLIALHMNKGKTVAQCLADRTDYSENAEKTENGKYISSFACDPKTCDEEFLLSKRQYEHITGRTQAHDVIAYQIRQSFKPGEITPEEANAVGYELAMRFTKGKHAFIVATHVDKAHIHNHVIFNSTSLDCTKKFRNFYFSGLAVARLSDLICMEHQLSVILRKPYEERIKRTEYPQRKPYRDEIREAIDGALERKPKDFADLICMLQEEGYVYKPGKQPALLGKGQKRYIRFRSLGDEYSVESLTAVLDGTSVHKANSIPKSKANAQSRQAHQKPEMSFLIDIQEKMQEGKGAGYARWAKVFNLKQMAQAMMFMQEHGIQSYEELTEKAVSITERCDSLLESVKADEARLQEIAVLKTHIINYAKAKDTFAEYKKSGYSQKYFEEHREVLTLRRAAKQAFDAYKMEHGKDASIPHIKDLSAEYAQVLARKKRTYSEYRKTRSEMQEWLLAQRIVQTILGKEDNQEKQEQQRQTEQEKENR
ncbi:MAG: relaxase/mobilization nuclease domain-containing protein [Fusicatenibacter sp.]